jgi:hypothetical protein
MKLIHVVLIVAIFGFAVSQICDGYEFTEIRDHYVIFNGNLNFATAFDIKKANTLKTLEKINIKSGEIHFFQDGKEFNQFYFSPRLQCDPEADSNKKVCLLQYISIKNLDRFFLNQIQFRYTIIPSPVDCETELRQALNDNISKDYGVEYFEADYQIFFLNLRIDKEETKKLNFNTQTRKFRWENEIADLESVKMVSEKGLTRLTLGDFYDNDIHYTEVRIIKKIQLLFNECMSKNNMFYFFHSSCYDSENKIYPKSFSNRGEINLSKPNGVTAEDKTFSILDYKSAKSFFPIYEKYNLILTLQEEQNKNLQYTLYIRIPSRECRDQAFKLLANHSVGCSAEAPQSLNYSTVVNLQNREKDFSQDIIKGLNFKTEEGVIEEREGESLSLKLVINKINVYDIELRFDLIFKQYWLYIKGIDLEGEIINKKYLLKITENQQHCMQRLQNLEKEMFEEFAKQGKVFLWQGNSSETDITINQSGGSKEFIPLAVIDVFKYQIILHGEVYWKGFKKLKLENNKLKVTLKNKEKLPFKLNKRCSERLEMLLSFLTAPDANNVPSITTRSLLEETTMPMPVKGEKPKTFNLVKQDEEGKQEKDRLKFLKILRSKVKDAAQNMRGKNSQEFSRLYEDEDYDKGS